MKRKIMILTAILLFLLATSSVLAWDRVRPVDGATATKEFVDKAGNDVFSYSSYYLSGFGSPFNYRTATGNGMQGTLGIWGQDANGKNVRHLPENQLPHTITNPQGLLPSSNPVYNNVITSYQNKYSTTNVKDNFKLGSRYFDPQNIFGVGGTGNPHFYEEYLTNNIYAAEPQSILGPQVYSIGEWRVIGYSGFGSPVENPVLCFLRGIIKNISSSNKSV